MSAFQSEHPAMKSNKVTALCFSSLRLSFPGAWRDDMHGGDSCPYCMLPLSVLEAEKLRSDMGDGDEDVYDDTLRGCIACGWWNLRRKVTLVREADSYCTVDGWSTAEAVLKRTPVEGIEIPAADLRRHLVRQYESRFDIHPRKLEEMLFSIFREHGFEVELTAYTKDGGIDLFVLRDPAEGIVAVQAKRNRNTRKIGIEEIDRFLGVLVRNDICHGLYVTASSYTYGARESVSELKSKGYFLELWDADDLLKVLQPSGKHGGIQSAQAAWTSRYGMPIEMEKIGDYFGGVWPTILPSDEEVTRWVKGFEKGLVTSPTD